MAVSESISRPLAALFVVGLTLSPTDARSQASDPPAPFTDPATLGGLLEPPFAQMLAQCGIPKLERAVKTGILKKDYSVTVSEIPKPLRDILPVSSHFVGRNDTALARMFSFLYPQRNADQEPAAAYQLYKQDLTADAKLMSALGTGLVSYAHSCGSLISLAMSADSGVSLGVASLQSALKSEYSGSQRSVLMLTRGQFRSPLGTALSSGDDLAPRHAAHLQLWNWYATNAPATTDASPPTYYIEKLDNAVALVTLLEQRRKAEASLQASGSASLAFSLFSLRTKSDLGARISDENSLDVQRYDVFWPKEPASSLAFAEVPSPSKIASVIRSEMRTRPTDANLTLWSGVPNVHHQIGRGIPPQLCRLELWRITQLGPAPDPGVLALLNVQPLDPPDGCDFSVQYTRTTSDPQSIELRYLFAFERSVGGVELLVPAVTIYYTPDQSPQVTAGAYDRSSSFVNLGADTGQFSWSIDLTIGSVAAVIQWGGVPLPPSLALKCSSRQLPLSATMTLNHATNSAHVVFSVVVEGLSALDASKQELCEVTGDVYLPRTGAPALSRKFPSHVSVLARSKRDTPPAVVPGGSPPPGTPAPEPAQAPAGAPAPGADGAPATAGPPSEFASPLLSSSAPRRR